MSVGLRLLLVTPLHTLPGDRLRSTPAASEVHIIERMGGREGLGAIGRLPLL